MEISQKQRVTFRDVEVVDLCMNAWVCVVFLLEVCLMFVVTELCQSVQTQSLFVAVILFQLLI